MTRRKIIDLSPGDLFEFCFNQFDNDQKMMLLISYSAKVSNHKIVLQITMLQEDQIIDVFLPSQIYVNVYS